MDRRAQKEEKTNTMTKLCSLYDEENKERTTRQSVYVRRAHLKLRFLHLHIFTRSRLRQTVFSCNINKEMK